MEKTRKEIGLRIKESRNKKDISQVELANIIGINKGLLWKYENGKSDAETGTLISISKCLDVDLLWLITGEDQADNLGNGTVSDDKTKYGGDVLIDDDREMLDLYRKLPPEKREVLKLLVNQMLPKEKKEV